MTKTQGSPTKGPAGWSAVLAVTFALAAFAPSASADYHSSGSTSPEWGPVAPSRAVPYPAQPMPVEVFVGDGMWMSPSKVGAYDPWGLGPRGPSWLAPCQSVDQLPPAPPRFARWPAIKVPVHVFAMDPTGAVMSPPVLVEHTVDVPVSRLASARGYALEGFAPYPDSPYLVGVSYSSPWELREAPQGTTCGPSGPGNVAPWPSAQVTVLDACDRTVRFDAYGSFDVDGLVVSWTWSFGDDEVSDSPMVEHVFPGPGTYRVGLHVRDDQGATSFAAGFVEVPPCIQAPPTTVGPAASSMVAMPNRNLATVPGPWES